MVERPFTDVEVDFDYCYQNGGTSCYLGRKLIEGYLQLEGKKKMTGQEFVNGYKNLVGKILM